MASVNYVLTILFLIYILLLKICPHSSVKYERRKTEKFSFGKKLQLFQLAGIRYFYPRCLTFLVAKLLYKSKCPSVCLYVCLSDLGGNVIFSDPN